MGRSSRFFVFLSISLLVPAFAGAGVEASGRLGAAHAFVRGAARHRHQSQEGVAALLAVSPPGGDQASEPPLPPPRFAGFAGPAIIRPCVHPLILKIGDVRLPRSGALPRVVYGTPACPY